MIKFKTVYRICLFGLLFCSGILSCGEQKAPEVAPAFYHWKTVFQPGAIGRKYLDELGVKRLYVKFFDVDKKNTDASHEALATFAVPGELPGNLEIVPCIFITNRSLRNIPAATLQDLAGKIATKIKAIATKIACPEVKEVQIDCDWTRQTAAAYFSLLEQIRQEFKGNIVLSATIRLHQVKYPEKTGVPPVDKGMLMYYNMGNVESEETENSILDNTVGRKYLSKLADYPLPLDIALPLFSWGVVFRDGNFVKLINLLTESDLESTFFNKEKQYFYKSLEDTYVKGAFVYKGDVIRVESSGKTALREAAGLLRKYRKREDMTVAFYHLDEALLEKFAPEFLAEVCRAF